MSNINESRGRPMAHSQALNIIELDEGANTDVIEERIEELVFPVKQFFLQQVPIRLVWKKRMAQLQKWMEAEEILLHKDQNTSVLSLPIFDVLEYESQRSKLLLNLSKSVSPSKVLTFANGLLQWEEQYGQWIIGQGERFAVPLIKDPPKATEKADSAEVLRIYRELRDDWIESPVFLHEFARLSKLAKIAGRPLK